MDYALVFDFGGVLMKTESRAPRWAWDDRLKLARGTVESVVHGSESWRLAQHGLLPVSEYWMDVSRQLGLTAAQTDELERDFFSGDRLDMQMVEFLQVRKASGQQVALLSNDSPALRSKLSALGIEQLFDPLVISAEIGVMKPAPEAYQYILDRLGCEPGAAVFVDDMPANVAGAQAVGMIGLHYIPGLRIEEALERYL